MKKRWSIFIAMMILCIAVCVPVLADAVPTLELVASKQIASPGNEFTVDIVIHNNPGIAVANFAISYDESVLQLTEATDQSLTGWDVGIKADPEKTEEVNREKAAWVMVDRSNWDENGCSILQLTFRVLDQPIMGSTEINLTELVIANIDEKKIPFTATPATVTIQEEPAGVTVSGTVTSYGDAAEKVTVTLLQGETSVGTWSGTTGPYILSNVAPGTYTLRVEKKGHATFTKEITVTDSNVTENVAIYQLGDVNMSGDVTVLDANQIRKYCVGGRTFNEYQLLLADVNGSGDVTVLDANQVRQRLVGIRDEYYKKINEVFYE